MAAPLAMHRAVLIFAVLICTARTALAEEPSAQTLGDAIAAIALHGQLEDVDFTAQALGGINFHLNDAGACENCDHSVEQLVPDRAPAGAIADHFEYLRESGRQSGGRAVIRLDAAVIGCVDPNRMAARANARETFVNPGMWPLGWVRAYTTSAPAPVTIGFIKSAGLCVLTLQQTTTAEFHGVIDVHPRRLGNAVLLVPLLRLSQLPDLGDLNAVVAALGANLQQTEAMVREPGTGQAHQSAADVVFLNIPAGTLPETLHYSVSGGQQKTVSLSFNLDPSLTCLDAAGLRSALLRHGFVPARRPYAEETLHRKANRLTIEIEGGRCVGRIGLIQAGTAR